MTFVENKTDYAVCLKNAANFLLLPKYIKLFSRDVFMCRQVI